MKQLTIMCGVPASGKSSLAKSLAEETGAVHVSRDEIRFSMIDNTDEYFSKEKDVFSEFMRITQEHLDGGTSVILDATHINRINRKKVLDNLDLEGVYVKAISVETPFDVCLKRNSERKGRSKVPKSAMESMNRCYTRPTRFGVEKRIDEVQVIEYKED